MSSFLELGICDDKKKLKKKRTRRTLKEGDPGYLKSASESDSALDDSTEYDTIDSDSDQDSPDPQDKVRQKAMEVSQDAMAKAGLMWLKSCLEDELEDREEEDEAVPIVPITEDCILAMERPSFISVLELIDLSPPNDQEQYWRIPSKFSARNLSEKSKLLAQLAEDELDCSVLDLSLILSKTKSEEKVRKMKKVKKKKTWMPMRRTVDPEVVDRIHNAVAATKSGTDKKATPFKKKGKRVVMQKDSSSESDKEGSDKAIEPKSRSFVDSSDSSDDDEDKRKTPASSSKRKNRQVIKSDDSSGDEKSSLSSSGDEVDNPSIQASQPKKEKASQQKRLRVSTSSSSSSDEGVIDPYPIQRVPSDTEEDVTQTTFNTTQEVSTTLNTTVGASTTLDTTRRSRSRSRSTSRSLSRSISSSSSSSYRSRSSLSSRSPSRSPIRSPVRSSSFLLSSNSNTPKRPRSSPSPSKNGKKLKTIPSGSSSEEEPVHNVKKKSSNLLISSDEEN